MGLIVVIQYNILKLTPPDSRGNHGVSESHGSRLEDVCNLRIDCRVVPSPVEVCTVATIRFVRDLPSTVIDKLARNKNGHPLIVDNVLVSGNGELSGTVEQPLIINSKITRHILKSISNPFSPILMDSEPKDTHGEQEWVLITTRVANSCTN